ncbi:MAG: hypothetical protein KJO82_08930, partial [Gammaproteobacteria bacterium]|nr:hypothetical protein [Gammaproteobacteria bacterium]
TDALGSYTCETGNTIAFSIGAVSIGQADCATLITPNQLATDNATFDLEVTNLTRFLQMLDFDGDPDNGIVISGPLQAMATNWTQVDFLTTDLATAAMLIMSDAASVDGTLHPLPSEVDALLHLVDTLACQYAGAYSGSISGSNSGAAGMVIGWGAASFGFIPFGFEWQAFDAANEFTEFGGGSGSMTVRALPTIDHTSAGLAGPITVNFTTPDAMQGTWSGGTVSLNRIGVDNGGEYRFVGKASSAEVEAYISLNQTGDILSGQAFDVIEGTLFEVSGTLTGDSAVLSATGGGATFSGTGVLTREADGTPREMTGVFDDGSTFSIAACRLNAPT